MVAPTDSPLLHRARHTPASAIQTAIPVPAQQRQVLLATSLSYALIMLDTSVVNVALQRMALGLDVTVSGLQWVISAYTLAFASALLTGGALGDRWGARKLYLVGLLLFTCASLACGVAASPGMLIAARVAQGLGAALLVPCSLKLIHQACPDPKQRARAIGLWASCGGIAMAAGPLIGGALTQWLGWRSIFFVNLPLGICGGVLAWRLLADPQAPQDVRFDWPGQLAASVALAALIGVLIEGQALGWTSPLMLSGAAIALVAGLAFVWIEARSPHAMLPLALFRQPIFAGSTLVSALSALVFYGLFFVTSLDFQQIRGYSPLHAGLAFVPLTAMVALASLLSHRVVRGCGTRWPMCAAFVLYAMGALGLMQGGSLPNLLSMIAIGLASGFISPAATAPAMEAVAPQAAGVAAATLNTARQTGAALGVAIFGSLVTALPSFTTGLSAALWAAAGLSLFAALVWGKVMARAAQPRRRPR